MGPNGSTWISIGGPAWCRACGWPHGSVEGLWYGSRVRCRHHIAVFNSSPLQSWLYRRRFHTKNDGFLTKNDGFLTKNDGFEKHHHCQFDEFLAKNDEFDAKERRLYTKNDEFHAKNDGFDDKSDGFHAKNDEFMLKTAGVTVSLSPTAGRPACVIHIQMKQLINLYILFNNI